MITPRPDPDLPEDEDAIWDTLFESTGDQLDITGEDARAAYEASQTDEPDDEDDSTPNTTREASQI